MTAKEIRELSNTEIAQQIETLKDELLIFVSNKQPDS